MRRWSLALLALLLAEDTLTTAVGSGFYVYAHCLGRSTLVAQAESAVQTTTPITFQRGPCFWEIKANGTWSLQLGS